MKKGFTLIELLIVIGILAILATATILVLNPAQLFAQARDSQRISDLASLRSAISFYLSTVSSPNLQAGTPAFTCGTSFGSSFGTATAYSSLAATTLAHGGNRDIDGDGWVAIDFGLVSGGSPLATLPSDPTNDAANNYQYSCNNNARTFELNANMQSTRYSTGADNVEINTKDGGNDNDIYEVGTNLAL